MAISGIYMLTFPSGKKYVGQSWDIEYRWYLYSKCITNSPKLKNALSKYDFNEVELEVIESVNESQSIMDERGMYWISEHKCVENGYNLMSGGKGGKHSPESIEKMRLANKEALRKPKNTSEFQRNENRNRYKGKTWRMVDGKRVWFDKEESINE